MRIGFLLTVSLLGMALLVGVLGGLLERTSNAVGKELDDLRGSSIEEVLGADGMEQALRSTEAAAYRLVAERYRQQPGDASHESEWGSVPQLDLDAIDESIEHFEDSLAQTRRALELASNIGSRLNDGESGRGIAARSAQLREIEREFAVHQQLHERLVHLMRYHPTDRVLEFLQEDFEPHYQDRMRPLIRRFARSARADLTAEAEAVERLLNKATLRNRWLAGIAFGLAVLLGILLSRAISRPLVKLRDAALRVGTGDLQQHVDLQADNEFGVLAQAFNEMAANLSETTVSRGYLDNILQSMREIVLVFDPDGRVQTANQVAVVELGEADGELIGRSLAELTADGSHDLPESAGETDLLRADGTAFPASFSRSELKGPQGESEGFVLVARNITERRLAEEELRRSLHDKDLLLKEVHHRVKNNLQIISSLLRLQEGDLEAGSRGLRESQNRIRSMALIHEHLYQSTDLANIDFGAYLEELVENLLGSYGPRARGLKAELEVQADPPNLDTAIPCGMIVNELVANAVEHGFDREGTLKISYRPDDGYHVLEVEDDGRGLPPNFDITTTRSLGLRLVSALTQQIGGVLEYTSEGRGTVFAIRFSSQDSESA